MTFHPFDLEHYQSQHERKVEINLADSSVKCIAMHEWLSENEQRELMKLDLFYPEVNGTQLLRERIAHLYPKASADNVLVTVGASQANKLICETLLDARDEIIVISPGYRQMYGLAKNIGCDVKELFLPAENNWKLNLDQLAGLISSKTKMLAIVNPNNPTGSILSSTEMSEIVSLCQRHDIWLHADEVYCGTEIEDETTDTFWGKYDKLICTNSLSKAYRLAGLRIGWAIAHPGLIQALWRRHEYAVIAASGPSMKLAEIALRDDKRTFLLDSQKKLMFAGRKILQNWIKSQNGLFTVNPSPATAVSFVRYHFDMTSHDLAEQIREQASVLIAPGSYLGTENHLRITVGYEPEKVTEGLRRIAEVSSLYATTRNSNYGRGALDAASATAGADGGTLGAAAVTA